MFQEGFHATLREHLVMGRFLNGSMGRFHGNVLGTNTRPDIFTFSEGYVGNLGGTFGYVKVPKGFPGNVTRHRSDN